MTAGAITRAEIVAIAPTVSLDQLAGQYVGKRMRAVCSDGIARSCVMTHFPDTFFSIPARVTVRGKTISGYLTSATVDGSDVETSDDPAILTFRAYRYGKNADVLPHNPVWR